MTVLGVDARGRIRQRNSKQNPIVAYQGHVYVKAVADTTIPPYTPIFVTQPKKEAIDTYEGIEYKNVTIKIHDSYPIKLDIYRRGKLIDRLEFGADAYGDGDYNLKLERVLPE